MINGNGTYYNPRYQLLEPVPAAYPLFIEILPSTNQMVIKLRKASKENGEVGQYLTSLSASLNDYPAVKRDYKIQIHVLNPCKNFYKSETASKRDGLPVDTLYAGEPAEWFYDITKQLYVGG